MFGFGRYTKLICVLSAFAAGIVAGIFLPCAASFAIVLAICVAVFCIVSGGFC